MRKLICGWCQRESVHEGVHLLAATMRGMTPEQIESTCVHCGSETRPLLAHGWPKDARVVLVRDRVIDPILRVRALDGSERVWNPGGSVNDLDRQSVHYELHPILVRWRSGEAWATWDQHARDLLVWDARAREPEALEVLAELLLKPALAS